MLIERFSTAALIAVGAVVATGAVCYLPARVRRERRGQHPLRAVAGREDRALPGRGGGGGVQPDGGRATLGAGWCGGTAAALAGAAARFAAAVKLEAAAVAGVLIAAGVLTTLPPADTPGTVLAGTWVRSAQGITTTVELAP